MPDRSLYVPKLPRLDITVHSRLVTALAAASLVLTVPAIAVARHAHAAAGDAINTAALGHDAHSDVYRVPFGTVSPGDKVTLRFRTGHDNATSVTARVTDSATGEMRLLHMKKVAENVSCYGNVAGTCDFWQTVATARNLGTLSYHFLIHNGDASMYYADQSSLFGGMGVASAKEVADDYRIHVVQRDFRTLPSLENGIMYQIFPDRFDNGDTANDPSPTEPRYDYPAPPNATDQQKAAAANAQIQDRSWSQLPEGYCRDYVNPAQKCTEQELGRDYFGGDLEGVSDKLDYLRSLGVTILYINPIFSSASDHAYDVRDFKHIDPAFGGDGALDNLIRGAHQHNMEVILDGPFDPTSSDSPYFDRYHHYTVTGACENPDSPYRSWFTFHDLPAGTDGPCAGSKPGILATYDEWGGTADALPLITKKDPKDPSKPYAPVADYFYKGADSVAQYWLNKGVDGWRLDSMQDSSFPMSYWQQFRTAVKSTHPNAPLIAEAWHWNDNMPLTNGDTADTPMGYRFRAAVLSLLGATGHDKGFPGEDDPNVPVSQFVSAMQSIQQDYAPATYRTFMNLLDSHDTPRTRWMLTPGQNNREDKEFNAANVAVGMAKDKVATTMQFTLPGMPSIYYGDEVGMTGSDDPDNRRTFPWTSATSCTSVDDYCAGGDHDLLSFYKSLTTLRSRHPVFREGDVDYLLADDSTQTLAYSMRTSRDIALVLVNRSDSKTRTLSVPTASVVRDGVTFDNALGGGTATTAAGKLSMTLPPTTARVLLLKPGQDITPPAAPKNVTARAGADGTVDVGWSGSGARYVVSRSPLSGGGYEEIGRANGTSFVDRTAKPGARYHYVIRAVDRLGNGSGKSTEACATAFRPITSAKIVSPTNINEEITAKYTTVTAQVTAPGITDPDAIVAQVGLKGHWTPMTGNAGLQYTGQVRADKPGKYQYVARFSGDGGRHWVYSDADDMTVTPGSDTTPPPAPTATVDWSASALTLNWTDTGSDVAEYRIYRGDRTGAETPLATVSGTSYVDADVSAGNTYYYVVRAVDQQLNISATSAEVSHVVEAKVVQVTFRVQVPADTPPDQTVYLAGATNGLPPGAADPLCAWCGGTASTALHKTADNTWQTTIGIPDGAGIQWKYTRGNWDTVETTVDNRSATVSAKPGQDGQILDGTVPSWRDALVDKVAGTATGITVTFNWPVHGDGADPTDVSKAIAVTDSTGKAVAGTVGKPAGTATLVWTPGQSLAAGSYSVTVDHVISEPDGGTGSEIAAPYTTTVPIG
jgi:glycosidase